MEKIVKEIDEVGYEEYLRRRAALNSTSSGFNSLGGLM
jgi:hypothetical protein